MKACKGCNEPISYDWNEIISHEDARKKLKKVRHMVDVKKNTGYCDDCFYSMTEAEQSEIVGASKIKRGVVG